MLASATRSSARHLLGVLFLFLAGSLSCALALPAPAPNSLGSSPIFPFSAEGPAQGSTSESFGALSPCGRSDTSSWVPAPAWETDAVFDFQEVFRKATVERRLAMLVIYDEGCAGWTRLVSPLLSNKEILSITTEKFHVYAVNADDEDQIFLIDGQPYSVFQLVDMLGVEEFPTFVVFKGDGKLVNLIEHPESQHELRSAINLAVESENAEVTRGQIATRNAAEGDLHTLLAESAQSPSHFVLNFDDKIDERPVAVFFEKSDCHHCVHFREHILSDIRTRSLLKRFRVARVDHSSTSLLISPSERQLTVAQWSQELGVTNTPAVVFFDKSGNRIRHTSDHTDLFRFQSLLEYVISGAYQSDASFAHYLRHRAQHLHEHGYDIDTRLY